MPRAAGALKAAELAQLMKEGAVVPVDTREAAAFGRAHLPGAVNFPLEEIQGRLAELAMLAAQPVVYCRAGDKTKDLAATLAEAGVPVAFLEGGMLAWEAEGLPVERPVSTSRHLVLDEPANQGDFFVTWESRSRRGAGESVRCSKK